MIEHARNIESEVPLPSNLEIRLGGYFMSNPNWLGFASKFPDEARQLAQQTLVQMRVFEDVADVIDDETFMTEADAQARIAFKQLEIPLGTVLDGTSTRDGDGEGQRL